MDLEGLFQKFQGIFQVMPAVLLLDENLDEAGQRRVIELLVSSKLHGLWVMGSGGEGGILPERTRTRLVEVTVEAVAGRVPVIVGVGETGTRRTIERIQAIEDLGVDAVAVTPPYYYVHSQAELLVHYQMILSETSLPLVLYNFPAVTKNPLALDTVRRLASHERVIGIKDSSGDFGNILNLIKLSGENAFRVFVGWDNLLASTVLAGGSGAVLFLPVFAPKLVLATYQAARAGDLKSAYELQAEMDELIPLTGDSDSAGIASMKEALALRGLCGRTVVMPLAPITPEHARLIKKVMTEKSLLD